jgi:catalase
VLQAKDFNHATHGLMQVISQGQYPKWDLYIQVLSRSS